MNLPVHSGETYSIVIANLQHYCQPSFIQNRIYLLDQQTGFPKTSQAGFPFGKYATSENFTGEHGIAYTPSLALATPKNIFDTLDDGQKDVTNAIKTFVNKRPAAFFWHHGGNDERCSFHGLHIHMIVHSAIKLHDVNMFRMLKSVLTKYGLQVKCQKVVHLEALMNHLQTEPRVLLSCNNLSLCARLKKTQGKNPFYTGLHIRNFTEDDTIEQIRKDEDGGAFMNEILKYKEQTKPPNMLQVIDNLSKQTEDIDKSKQPLATFSMEDTEVKETKTAKKIDELKTLMKKYSKTNEEDLLKEIMKEGDVQDLVRYRVLYTGPLIHKVHYQAVQELKLENDISRYSYIDRFIDECPSPVDTMSIEETAKVHLQWCREQNIDVGDYLMKQFAILDKTFPKVNCFCLQGQSNAGKMFWTVPLMPFSDSIGQTVQSQDFMFQRCLQKEVIQIPELSLSKPEQVEEVKKIFEGLPTTINIKNREPKVLERTPVILTCNGLHLEVQT